MLLLMLTLGQPAVRFDPPACRNCFTPPAVNPVPPALIPAAVPQPMPVFAPYREVIDVPGGGRREVLVTAVTYGPPVPGATPVATPPTTGVTPAVDYPRTAAPWPPLPTFPAQLSACPGGVCPVPGRR